MLSLRATCLADTHAIAAGVAGVARAGDIIVLAGEMGAGKTAFAQGFGRAVGVDEPVTSPTFTLVHTYDAPGVRGGSELHHADIYRLERLAEVSDLALGELAETGVVLVEWGDVVDGAFGEHLTIHLDHDDDPADDAASDDDDFGLDAARLIDIAGVGAGWAARWERLARSVESFRC